MRISSPAEFLGLARESLNTVEGDIKSEQEKLESVESLYKASFWKITELELKKSRFC